MAECYLLALRALQLFAAVATSAAPETAAFVWRRDLVLTVRSRSAAGTVVVSDHGTHDVGYGVV